MLTRSRPVIIAVVGCAIILAVSAQSFARRGGSPATTTAPATRTSDKSVKAAPKANTKSPSRYDDEDDEPMDQRTGKARAQQYEKGKPVDKSKTKTQLDKLTGQVGSLEAALRNSKNGSKATAKYQEDEEEDLPAQRRKSRRPTTQPATQPAKAAKSTRSRYVEDDYDY